MSSAGGWRVLAAAAALTLGTAVGAAAQDAGAGARTKEPAVATPADRSALEARLEAQVADLRSRLDEASARAEAGAAAARAEANRHPTTPMDTVAVGPFAVVTPAGQAERARALWSAAWAALDGVAPASSALDGRHFGFQWRTQVPLAPYTDAPAVRVGTRWLGPAAAPAAVRDALGSVLVHDLPDDVRRWIRDRPVTPPDWLAVHRALLAEGGAPGQACVAGDAAACLRSLGDLAGETKAEAVASLSPAERRARVAALKRRPVAPSRRACLAGHDDACAAVLRGAPLSATLPLLDDAPPSLLWVALEMGGPGAFERLRAPAPAGAATDGFLLRPRLAAAAGVPADSVAAAWRARVLAARPERGSVGGVAGLAALLWVYLLAFLATRSTRWRFG